MKIIRRIVLLYCCTNLEGDRCLRKICFAGILSSEKSYPQFTNKKVEVSTKNTLYFIN